MVANNRSKDRRDVNYVLILTSFCAKRAWAKMYCGTVQHHLFVLGDMSGIVHFADLRSRGDCARFLRPTTHGGFENAVSCGNTTRCHAEG